MPRLIFSSPFPPFTVLNYKGLSFQKQGESRLRGVYKLKPEAWQSEKVQGRVAKEGREGGRRRQRGWWVSGCVKKGKI